MFSMAFAIRYDFSIFFSIVRVVSIYQREIANPREQRKFLKAIGGVCALFLVPFLYKVGL